MWKHKTLEIGINQSLINSFKKYAKIGGTIFIVLGVIGMLFPTFMTFGTLAFVSYLMLFAGVSSAWLTWVSNRHDWTGWLKSFILILVAIYMIVNPMNGVATLGLLFSIYYFMDAFASLGIAFSVERQKHKWIWIFNAITSLVLAIIFIINWPFSSLWLVGFLVGISLFFDGIALLSGGAFLNEIEKENTEPKA